MLLISNRRSPSRASSVGFLGSLLLLFFLCAVSVSAAESDHDESPDALEAAAAILQPAAPVAGFKLLFGEAVTLDRRQQGTCSANGSNFCFGDNVNFCASCGVCCGSSASGYCCGADQLCCGSACCAAGQTCTNGQCFLPVETVTVTSATTVTVSHVATQVVTVEQAVVSTSTVFSTTDVTVSSGGTETDVVYVTVTAPPASKRSLLAGEDDLEPREEGVWATLRLFAKRFTFLPWSPSTNDSPRARGLQRRAERPTQAPLSAIASSTVVTTSVTQTSDVTSFVSATTTVPTSSVVVTTVVQTRTRVLSATTTITVTSTLTVTPRGPETQTVTKTQTNPTTTGSNTGTGTGGATPPADGGGGSSSGGSGGLSTAAKAGIGGGIGGAAALVLIGLALWYWRRRRNRPPPHQDPSSYLEPYVPDMSEPLPPPPRASPSTRYDAPAANLDRYANITGGPPKKPLSPPHPGAVEASNGEVYEADGTSRPYQPPAGQPIYEADSGSPRMQHAQQPPYPVDDAPGVVSPVSPETAGAGVAAGAPHERSNSESSSHYGSQAGGDMGFSPVDDRGAGGGMMGDAAERIRNTNPYRSPGAYRDF